MGQFFEIVAQEDLCLSRSAAVRFARGSVSRKGSVSPRRGVSPAYRDFGAKKPALDTLAETCSRVPPSVGPSLWQLCSEVVRGSGFIAGHAPCTVCGGASSLGVQNF